MQGQGRDGGVGGGPGAREGWRARSAGCTTRLWVSLTLVLLLLGDATANHYQYSTLNWQRQPGGHTVHFTLRSAWSTEFQPYKDQVASDGGVIRVGQVIRIQGLGDPVLSFGDGAGSFRVVKATVTTVDHTLKTWVGEAKVAHTYATASNNGKAWVASFGGCCRDSDVRNRDSGFFNVTTAVNLAQAAYSPIIATLPRQVLQGGLNSRGNNSFWVAAYDQGKHPSKVAGKAYTWAITWQAPPMSPLAIDPSTGQVWGHIAACPTQSPSTACLYAMRVRVTDSLSGAMSEVDFELEVFPAAVTNATHFPRYLDTLSDAVQGIPAVNNVYMLYSYVWSVNFKGGQDTVRGGLDPQLAGLLYSALPDGARMGASVSTAVGRYGSNLSWEVPADSSWRILCVQAYNNGTQAYRGLNNLSLPVRSRQVCLEWSADVDPSPVWMRPANLSSDILSAVNMSSDYTAVYMGEQMMLDLTAHDENTQDTLFISNTTHIPMGGSLSAQQVRGSGNTVQRLFTFAPPEKLGGLAGETCFQAVDRPPGVGEGGMAKVCVKYRVPKCLYRVTQGQTLLDIASLYGVNWLQLWALNKNISRPEGHGLPGGIRAGDVIHVGQLVLVRQGDSLERIAARFGTTLRQIIALNQDISPTRPLTAGQLVCLVPVTCMDRPAAHSASSGLYYA